MTENYTNTKRDFSRLALTALIASLLAACAVGPDYKRPTADVPSKYKENASWHEDWATAEPADAFKRGAWWEIFGDAKLNELEAQVEGANKSLAQAEAQYRQAAALVSQARASYFPTLSVSASATRSGRNSDNGSIITGTGTVIGGTTGSQTTRPRIGHQYSIPVSA